MQASAERSERLVCAVLAAQVAAIRDRIESDVPIDLLWRAVDLLSQLSSLVQRQDRSADATHSAHKAAMLRAEGEITRTLESVAFMQAQRFDATRQMADCVVTGLERMAVGQTLSPAELVALYVSEEQRQVHDAAVHQFAAAGQQEGAGR